MNILATIDTNVLVSSVFHKGSYPDKIISKIQEGEIVPVLNQDIIFEYIDVLTRDKFGFSKIEISRIINGFIDKGVFAERTESNEYFIDEDDAVFYEVTLTARKNNDAYLVTGNRKHFPIKPFVVSPKEMYEIAESIKSE